MGEDTPAKPTQIPRYWTLVDLVLSLDRSYDSFKVEETSDDLQFIGRYRVSFPCNSGVPSTIVCTDNSLTQALKRLKERYRSFRFQGTFTSSGSGGIYNYRHFG